MSLKFFNVLSRHFQPGEGPWLWNCKLREGSFEALILVRVHPNGQVTAYRECRCSMARGGDCSPQWIRVSEYYKYLSPATNWNMQPIFLSSRPLTIWTSYLESLLNRCAVSCCSTFIQSWLSIFAPFPSIFDTFWDHQEGYFEYCSWQWAFVLFALCHCPLTPGVGTPQPASPGTKYRAPVLTRWLSGFCPYNCASDSNAAEQKSKSALFSLIVLLPRGRGSVWRLELELYDCYYYYYYLLSSPSIAGWGCVEWQWWVYLWCY